MSYIIRNYGSSRTFPFKSTGVSIGRDGTIVTDDLELINAFTGQPQISIVKQPGTVDVPPPAPIPIEEDIDYAKLLKRELLELCKKRGLEVPNNATKAVIIEILIADDEKSDEDNDDDDQGEDNDDQGSLAALTEDSEPDDFEEFASEIEDRCEAAGINPDGYPTWREAEMAVREMESDDDNNDNDDNDQGEDED